MKKDITLPKKDLRRISVLDTEAEIAISKNFRFWILRDELTGRTYNLHRTPKRHGLQLIGCLTS